MSTPVAVLLQLLRFYGDAAAPDRRSISRVFDDRPYDALLARLGQMGRVVDTTDINEDVSFAWAIEVGSFTWLIRLSMVGPYALVTDYEGRALVGPCGTLIDGALAMIEEEGFVLTGRSFNDRGVDVWGPEEGLASCFQALFQMGGEPPWSLM